MAINYINTGTSANKGDGDSLRTAFIKINQNFAYVGAAVDNQISIQGQTISGTVPDQDISLLPSGSGTVVVPSLKTQTMTVSEITTSSVAFVGVVSFEESLGYSFIPGTFLPAGTFGIPYDVPAPYSVFTLTGNPETIAKISVGDYVIASDSKAYPIIGRGSLPYINHFAVDLSSYQFGSEAPDLYAEVHVSRPIERTFTTFTSNSGTGILLESSNTEIQVGGTLIPHENDNPSYSLGLPIRRWSDVWVGAGSIHILDEGYNRDLKISARNGNLTIGKSGIEVGDIIIRDQRIELNSTSTFNFVLGTNTNIFSITGNGISLSTGTSITFGDGTVQSTAGSGAAANTGDVTFSGVKIIGAGTASGDGNGYSTLELVPDANLTTTNQYLVIDPTYPTHIHIRAGGTQDASTAELYLGGERNHVRVYDNVGVKLQNDLFTTNFYNFQQGVDYDTATWSTDEFGNTWLDITITDPMNPTRPSSPFDVPFYNFTQFPQNRIEVFDGTNYTDLIGNGQAYTLGNQYQLRIDITQAPGTNPTSISSLTFRVDTLTQNSLMLENNEFDLSVNQSAYVYADQTIQLTTGVGNIRITTDDNNSSPTWYFTAQGYMQFPQGLGPTTSKGKAGDEAGSVVFDGSYIYYCTTDYTDGVADIWKRVQWSNDTW